MTGLVVFLKEFIALYCLLHWALYQEILNQTSNQVWFYTRSFYYRGHAWIWLPSQLGLENTLTATKQRGKTPSQRVSWIWHEKSDGEVPVMPELCGMRCTHLLPSLPGPLRPGVVAPDMGPIYDLNRTNGILMLNYIAWLNWIAWNRNVFDN